MREAVSIPAQDLAPALRTLAKDRAIHLVFVSEDVKSVHTAGAEGSLTVEETLDKLLSGTGLTYQYLDPETITIIPLDPLSGSGKAGRGAVPAGTGSGRDGSAAEHSSQSNLRLAQSDQGGAQAPGVSAETTSVGKENAEQAAQKTSGAALQEVIVTAQKREERLLDAPVQRRLVVQDRVALIYGVRIGNDCVHVLKQ